MADTFKQRAKRVYDWGRRNGAGLLLPVVALLAFVIGYGLRDGHPSGTTHAEPQHQAAGAEQQWYTCAMHPEVRMPNPDDKCPICFMDLIPVKSASSDATIGPREISLSPQAQALIDVQTTPVTRRFIERRIDMVGKVDYDETKLAEITAYAGGRLDRLFVDYTGITVNQGDHLAEIYSPDLLVAQQELIGATRALKQLNSDTGALSRQSTESIAESARDRLRLLGMTTEQIQAIENGGTPGDHVTLYSPIGGVVIVKHANQGAYVKEGDRIYTIADLSEVWVILEAYESDLAWLRYGQAVSFTTESYGDATFQGRIVFIDPVLDPQKRTVRVRVNVSNPDGRLRPGMFVRASAQASIAEAGRVMAPELAGKWVSPMHPEIVRDEPGPCPICGMPLVPAEELGYITTDQANARPPLVVPDSAVLRTGRRGIVYVKTSSEPEPRFEGREVELGPRGDGFFIVRSGLAEGELVVTRGNFQIDSALQIQAKASMMNPHGGPAATGHVHPGSKGAMSPPITDPPATKTHLPDDAAKVLQAVIDAYLGLADALAKDDPAAAISAIETLGQAVNKANSIEVPASLKASWVVQFTAIHDAIGTLNQADNLETIRLGFETISNALITLTQSVHSNDLTPLYRAHCPMAFDFKGASWLAPNKDILNPYFGDKMLRCGSIKETLIAGPTAGGHDHE